MSKWKCDICNSSFENFDARGFDNKIYCPLCYYKKLYIDTELERERLNKRIEDLNIINDEHKILNEMIRKELQQKDNIIKEAREYLKQYMEFFATNDKGYEILKILDKGE